MVVTSRHVEISSNGMRPLAWSIKNAARQLGVCEATIHNLARAGKLKKIRIAARGSKGGGRTLIPDTEVRRIASEGA
jgi:hypothetical protein